MKFNFRGALIASSYIVLAFSLCGACAFALDKAFVPAIIVGIVAIVAAGILGGIIYNDL